MLQAGWQLAAQSRALGVEERRRVAHALEESRHLARADAFQVVADGDVEDDVALGLRYVAELVQDCHEEPRLRVLAQRVFDEQLLRPLDVVADGAHVDAGPADDEAVVDLDGLELQDPTPRQIRQPDVLGELRVRAGGRADGRGRPVSVEGDGEIEAGEALVDSPRRQVEDRTLRELLGGALHENRKGKRPQHAHAKRSHSRAASSRPRAWTSLSSRRVDLPPSTMTSPPATTSRTCRAPKPKRKCPARFSAERGVGGS